MALTFTARSLELPPKSWGIVTVLKDDTTDERYLMLQRKRQFSQRDIEWRQDDVYIEVCDQGWSWYGHILSFVSAPKKLIVRLDAEAAERMREDGIIEVELALSTDALESVRRSLREVFEGFSYFRETA